MSKIEGVEVQNRGPGDGGVAAKEKENGAGSNSSRGVVSTNVEILSQRARRYDIAPDHAVQLQYEYPFDKKKS